MSISTYTLASHFDSFNKNFSEKNNYDMSTNFNSFNYSYYSDFDPLDLFDDKPMNIVVAAPVEHCAPITAPLLPVVESGVTCDLVSYEPLNYVLVVFFEVAVESDSFCAPTPFSVCHVTLFQFLIRSILSYVRLPCFTVVVDNGFVILVFFNNFRSLKLIRVLLMIGCVEVNPGMERGGFGSYPDRLLRDVKIDAEGFVQDRTPSIASAPNALFNATFISSNSVPPSRPGCYVSEVGKPVHGFDSIYVKLKYVIDYSLLPPDLGHSCLRLSTNIMDVDKLLPSSGPLRNYLRNYRWFKPVDLYYDFNVGNYSSNGIVRVVCGPSIVLYSPTDVLNSTENRLHKSFVSGRGKDLSVRFRGRYKVKDLHGVSNGAVLSNSCYSYSTAGLAMDPFKLSYIYLAFDTTSAQSGGVKYWGDITFGVHFYCNDGVLSNLIEYPISCIRPARRDFWPRYLYDQYINNRDSSLCKKIVAQLERAVSEEEGEGYIDHLKMIVSDSRV